MTLVPFLRADWPAPPRIHAFTTLRHGAGISRSPFDSFNLGNCSAADGDDPGTVERNRAELVQLLDLPSAPHWLRQVHGITVSRFDALAPSPPDGGGEEGRLQTTGLRPDERTTAVPSGRTGWGGVESVMGDTSNVHTTPSQPPPAYAGGGAQPEADAAVTSIPGVVLAILTADCLPVVLAAEDGSEIAAAHAGWRGLRAGVLDATLAAMRTPPGETIAWLGPCAGPDAYEVGRDVHEAFVAHDPRAASAFTATRPGHWRVDLYALARQRLADAGVTRVHGGGLCTITERDRFYSHRRDGRTGRMATLVWRAP